VKTSAFLAAAALALAAPAASASPLVPAVIQATVKQKAGTQAYVPTRAPFRYSYLSYTWKAHDRILVVRLADKRYPNRAAHTIFFSVHRFTGDCATGNQKSYQLDGNKVYSDADVAWRCLPRVKILASGPNLPTVALGQVVASAKRVR
jgi:hypothetical protein